MAVDVVRHFLVERYLPGVASQDVDRATRRLEALGDGRVRHLLTVVVPGEETCLSIFEGPDSPTVRDVNERAGFQLDRIVEIRLIESHEAQ